MTLVALVVLPLVATGAILGARRLRELPGAVAVAGLIVELALALSTAIPSISPPAAWAWSGALGLHLGIEGLSRMMVALVPAIALSVVLYAWTSLRSDPGLPRLLALLVAFVGAMELLVLATDFLTLLIGWELVGAISWALIAHDWRDSANPRAALQAFLTTRAGDLGLYAAAGLTLAATGSLRFGALAAAGEPALGWIAVGVLLAAAAKSAQLPFSPWLFSAMAGPTPASALLHSATMVAAGAYALARLWPYLAPVAWFGPTVAWLGLGTALAGGVVALLQRDAKRILAASTSAQYGLMLVAIGAGVPAAAGLHLVTHAAFKALLFVGAGMLIHAAGSGDLGQLRSAGLRPRIALPFGVGILALAGVPPLGGAFTKDQILAAAAERGPGLALGTVLAGLLSALYAARLYLLAFGPGSRAPRTPTPEGERIGVGGLAMLSLALGLLWTPGAGSAAAALLGGRLARGADWELPVSLLSLAAAALVAWVAWRRRALLTLAVPDALRARIEEWLGIPALATGLVVWPVTRAAAALAAFDDRAVDAGIRASGRVAAALSRAFAWWGERTADRLPQGVAQLTMSTAAGSRAADDRGVDAAVEATARAVRRVGGWGRALQTGLSHQYYVIAAVGTLAAVLAALLRE